MTEVKAMATGKEMDMRQEEPKYSESVLEGLWITEQLSEKYAAVRRKFLFLSGVSKNSSQIERLGGFLQAIRERNIPESSVRIIPGEEIEAAHDAGRAKWIRSRHSSDFPVLRIRMWVYLFGSLGGELPASQDVHTASFDRAFPHGGYCPRHRLFSG